MVSLQGWPEAEVRATERPSRADAVRNRERVMVAARELLARHGREAQMEEIAAKAGVGVGTLYRHFPTKEALLTEIARERFRSFVPIAAEAEQIEDAFVAFATALRRFSEETEEDVGFQLAMLGARDFHADDIAQEKRAVTEHVARIIDRGVRTGALRADLTEADFPILMCALSATMYFKPGANPDWRRQLELMLDGLRGPGAATAAAAALDRRRES
jgi:AcrR family transcriptional regulator